MKINRRNKQKYDFSISNKQRQYLRSKGFHYEKFSKSFQRIIDIENSNYKIIQEVVEYFTIVRSDENQPNNRIKYSTAVTVIEINSSNNHFRILSEYDITSEHLSEIYSEKERELSRIIENASKNLLSTAEKKRIFDFFIKLNFAGKVHRKSSPLYDKSNIGKEIEFWYKRKVFKTTLEFSEYEFPVIKKNMPFIYDNISDLETAEIPLFINGIHSVSYTMPETVCIDRSKDDEFNKQIEKFYKEEIINDGLTQVPLLKSPNVSVDEQIKSYSVLDYINELYYIGSYFNISSNISFSYSLGNNSTNDFTMSVSTNIYDSSGVVKPVILNMQIIEKKNILKLKYHDKISSFVKETKSSDVYLHFVSFINPNIIPEDLSLEVVPESVYYVDVSREDIKSGFRSALPEGIPISIEEIIDAIFDDIKYDAEKNIEIKRCKNLEWNRVIDFSNSFGYLYNYLEVPNIREKVNRRYFND